MARDIANAAAETVAASSERNAPPTIPTNMASACGVRKEFTMPSIGGESGHPFQGRRCEAEFAGDAYAELIAEQAHDRVVMDCMPGAISEFASDVGAVGRRFGGSVGNRL